MKEFLILLGLIPISLVGYTILYVVNAYSWKKLKEENPDYKPSDFAEFYRSNTTYANPNDLRILVDKLEGEGKVINIANRVFILIVLLIMISIPVLNEVLNRILI